MKRTILRRGACLGMLVMTGACSMAPSYHPPQVVSGSVPTYAEAQGWAIANPGDALPRGAWWESFNDPVLDDLQKQADDASPTVAAAVARYDQARAAAHIDDAALFPTITAEGDVSRERASHGRPLSPGTGGKYTDRTIGGALDWEIDLWGRLRNAARASHADAAASEADLASARLSLHATVADTYFRLRGLDDQVELLRQTSEAYARAADLTGARHEGGIASGLDINRAHSQLSDAKSQLSQSKLQRATIEHALAVLVGKTPATFSIPPAASNLEPIAIPTGAPSQLLERRPDIAAAERRMSAANARIGVARAAWFPVITLGLSGGYETTHGNILSAANSFWGLGPLMAAATIFDGGRRAADVKRSRGVFDEAAADYRSTVLTAFREVEDALASENHLSNAQRDQNDAATAARRTADLALDRYRDGASDYLEVVVAQTASLDAQRSALALHTQRLQTEVSIIRALGGGFDRAAMADAGRAVGSK